VIDSILNSVKKRVNIAAEYTAFDEDIIVEINSAFARLTSLGLGPVEGFQIEDESTNWADYETAGVEAYHLNSVKSYIALKVRQVFDPPGSSYAVSAMERQILELEWLLNTVREAALYPIAEGS
jgi:hypothetical protein